MIAIGTAASDSTAQAAPALGVATLCGAFQATAVRQPDAVALRNWDGDLEVTWGEYARRVARIAAGLSGLGVARGDTVALMLTNRPEFHFCYTTVLHLGATPFSIYNTSAPEQIVSVRECSQPGGDLRAAVPSARALRARAHP